MRDPVLIEAWLTVPVIEEDDHGRPPASRPDRGSPQGGVFSPLLSNIYLHWFEDLFHCESGPGHWAKARLVRYADDFVILARYQDSRLIEWVERAL